MCFDGRGDVGGEFVVHDSRGVFREQSDALFYCAARS